MGPLPPKHAWIVLTADQRAAVTALASGLTAVRDLPLVDRVGLTDLARAECIFVFLRRAVHTTSREAALQALSQDDWLQEVGDGPYDLAHYCPVCGGPAVGDVSPWTSVCDLCQESATCRCGRNIDGANTSLAGGFVALHTDDGSECPRTTRDGIVQIKGVDCHMGEARLGGIFIGVLIE